MFAFVHIVQLLGGNYFPIWKEIIELRKSLNWNIVVSQHTDAILLLTALSSNLGTAHYLRCQGGRLKSRGGGHVNFHEASRGGGHQYI